MEDIKLSYEEKERFQKAFRQHDFRILFDEYFDEIADPKYRNEKEEYILNLYFSGELKKDQIVIKPEGVFCVKTKILYANQTNQKLFINICVHKGIESISICNISSGGVNIPYSLSQIRPDKLDDKISCMTIDCCVHPSTIDIIRSQNEFLTFLLEDVCRSIERNILKDKEKIGKDLKILKNLKCKGETPFLLCINKNALNKNVLKEEEKKLEKLREEYERNQKLCKIDKEILQKSKVKTEIKINTENKEKEEEEPLEEAETFVKKNKKQIEENKRVQIIHQGILDGSSFFRKNRSDLLHLNVPNKIKVVVQLNTGVSKQDISICVQQKHLHITFANEEEDVEVSLPYPCDAHNYNCVLNREKKRLDIYLNLCESYIESCLEKKEAFKQGAETSLYRTEEPEEDLWSYIDEIVEKENEKALQLEQQSLLKKEKMKEESLKTPIQHNVENTEEATKKTRTDPTSTEVSFPPQSKNEKEREKEKEEIVKETTRNLLDDTVHFKEEHHFLNFPLDETSKEVKENNYKDKTKLQDENMEPRSIFHIMNEKKQEASTTKEKTSFNKMNHMQEKDTYVKEAEEQNITNSILQNKKKRKEKKHNLMNTDMICEHEFLLDSPKCLSSTLDNSPLFGSSLWALYL